VNADACRRGCFDGGGDGEGTEMIVHRRGAAVASMEIVQDGAEHQPDIVHEWLLGGQGHVLHRLRAVVDDVQAIEQGGLHERTPLAIRPPEEGIARGAGRPGAGVLDGHAAIERQRRADHRVVGVVAPARVARRRREGEDFRAVEVADKVEMMDGLLPEHRLAHRQRVFIQPGGPAVAIAPVAHMGEAG
jgi:hypothetical protein